MTRASMRATVFLLSAGLLTLCACSKKKEERLELQRAVLVERVSLRAQHVKELEKSKAALEEGKRQIAELELEWDPSKVTAQLEDGGLSVTGEATREDQPSTTVHDFHVSGTGDLRDGAKTLREIDFPTLSVMRCEASADGGWTAEVRAITPRFHELAPQHYEPPELEPPGHFASDEYRAMSMQMEQLEGEYRAYGELLADAGVPELDAWSAAVAQERQQVRRADESLRKSRHYVPEDCDALGTQGPFAYGFATLEGLLVKGDAQLKDGGTRTEAEAALSTAENLDVSTTGRVQWNHSAPRSGR